MNVVDYIEQHGLYLEDAASSPTIKGKEREQTTSGLRKEIS